MRLRAPIAAPLLAVLAGLGGALAACGDAKRAADAACTTATQCASGLCYLNLCLVPGRDNDGDGLDNATEHALASNPLLADSDGDGKPDGVEVGVDAAHPANRDGDNLPDLLESAVADADRDCLADEADAHNLVPETDVHALAVAGCAHIGVCENAPSAITATCKVSVLACDYRAVPGFLATEACDGKDNDCDGQTDEGYTYSGGGIGEPCDGVGRCGSGVVECRGAKADCSTNPGGSADQSVAESCNGKDDNCSGETDEGFELEGLPVGSPCVGAGECGLGVVECGANGQPRCSVNPGASRSHAATETCNGLDDDCDGVTDNGILWQTTPLGAPCQTTGICGGGSVVCGAGGVAVCSSAPGNVASKAHAEVCNGLDDNCNGATDEGFDFAGIALGAACPAVGVCGAGTVVCSKSGAATCSTHLDTATSQASAELCNGKDDDCDGETDEQMSWQANPLGGACDGTGACGGGIVVCAADGQATCSTNADGGASEAKPEACNGADDDCDGQIDNDIATLPTVDCPVLGICQGATATWVCIGGGWQCTFSNPAFQITETTCDGLDNDCDGVTDEGLPLQWGEPSEAWTTAPSARTELAAAAGGGGLFVCGGLVDSALPGAETTSSSDIWRLDLLTLQWSRLAHNPLLARRSAGAVYLPAGGGGAQLLLVGGLDGAGAAAAPALVDVATGAPAVPLWSNQPEHRFSPSVVWLAPTQQVWLLGGTGSGAGPCVQRLDKATATWTAAVPQPAAALGPIAACADAGGNLYAYGQSALGGSFFAVLPPGAAAWQSLPAVASKAGQPGRLLCDVVNGEIWLVGGGSPADQPQPVRKYTVATQTWASVADAASGPSWPAGIEPAVAAFGGKLVVALGQTADGHGVAGGWVGLPQQWTAVDSAPEPVLGARLFDVGNGVVRVGGAALRVGKVSFDVPAWRHFGQKWQQWPLPASPSRAFANAVLTPDNAAILLWSGLTTLPTGGDWTSAIASQTPSGGVDRLDLATGTWGKASTIEAQWLPGLRADAAIAPGAGPGTWLTLGEEPTTGAVQLWLIEMLKAKKQLIWQSTAAASGPMWQPGSAIAWDGLSGRVIYICAGSPAALWHYDFGASEGWSQSAAALNLGGRVSLLGATADTDRLAVAFSLQGPLAVRRLKLDAEIAIVTPPQPQMALFGLPAVALASGQTGAWVAEPMDAAGVLQSVWLTWPQTCQP